MLNYKKWSILLMMFVLTITVTGCSKKIPSQVSTKLEGISGATIGFVALVDSDSGKAEYLRHEETIAEYTHKPQPASKIKKITSVSVVGVSGIDIEGTKYQSCNYINIDGVIELICRRNDYQGNEPPPDITSNIPTLPEEIASKLGKAGEINDVGFLVLTDIITGDTKLLKHENYVSLPTSLSQSISQIKSTNVWSVITYIKNPCCQWVDKGGGKQEWVCRKDINVCP